MQKNATDLSVVNQCSMNSAAWNTYTGQHTRNSIQNNQRFVNEIVNNIFDEKSGGCELSSSDTLTSSWKTTSQYSYDGRLKYWKDMLQEREYLKQKIAKQTFKDSEDVLLDYNTSPDERNKNIVKKLLDYSERMKPINIANKIPLRLTKFYNCRQNEVLVEETLARPETDANFKLEIVGLPRIIQHETMGKGKRRGLRSYHWLKSKELQKRIQENYEDIERVIEFYPDIENLQIVGVNPAKPHEHDEDIKLLTSEDITRISTDSESDAKCCLCNFASDGKPQAKAEEEIIEYGVRINDQIYKMSGKRISKAVEVEAEFSLEPFQYELRKCMTIENIGKYVLNFEWCHRSYFDKASMLLKQNDNEFKFDHSSFRLCSGSSRDIIVCYNPRKVAVVKTKWLLRIEPAFFCRKVDGIVLRLCGICIPPPEYTKKLNDQISSVIYKSNKQMVDKLTTDLGSIAVRYNVTDQPLCPYKCIIGEMDLFKQLNPAYAACCRYHDLETLKNIYAKAKKPREHPWNLSVSELSSTVLRVQDAEKRSLLYNELLSVLDCIKGKDLAEDLQTMPNKHNRCCFINVKGIICSTIDEWEGIVFNLESIFTRYLLADKEDVAKENVAREDVAKEDFDKENVAKLNVAKDDVAKLDVAKQNVAKKFLPKEKVSNEKLSQEKLTEEEGEIAREPKMLPKTKEFDDTLYMQTFSLLCNMSEDLASIIEGCGM